jgi:DNA-binding transcriptional regulator LsrR (DeoR family)
MGSSSLRQMLEMWKKIDVAVVSVGAPPVSQEFDGSTIIVNRKKVAAARRPPVGDVCARYFDIEGQFVEDEEYKRIIGIPVESLRGIGKIICVAGGIEKAYSLLGALKTGLITILVTDEQTAAAVMEAKREDTLGTIEKSIENLFSQTAAR